MIKLNNLKKKSQDSIKFLKNLLIQVILSGDKKIGNDPSWACMDSIAPAERKIMTLDRPFIYAIVDNRTGAVLFAGRVTEPLQGE